MFERLKAALGIGGSGADGDSGQRGEAVEYKGYTIIPEPFKSGSQFQTAGIIQKQSPSGIIEERFVRAEAHPSFDDAVAFSIVKGQRIVDEMERRSALT